MMERDSKRTQSIASLRIIFFFLSFFISSLAQAEITFKVSANNPSEFTAQEVVVKSYLPKSIKLEHVVDVGELEIGYDVRRGQYYVHKKIILDPQKAVSYDVVIQDIWLLDLRILEEIQAHVNRIVKKIDNSEYADIARSIQENIGKGIRSIIDKQSEFLIERVAVVEHINAYMLNLEELEVIREKVGTLEKLLQAVVGRGASAEILGNKLMGSRKSHKMVKVLSKGLGVGEVGSSEGIECDNVDGEELYLNKDPETVSFQIVIENPSVKEAIVPVSYFLAEEVKANDVVDSSSLSVGFDFEKELYYVFDRAVELAPSENREFNIVLQNKWKLDKVDIFSLKIHTKNMLKALEGIRGFVSVKEMGENVDKTLEGLIERKVMEEFSLDYVMQFREDQKTLEALRESVTSIEETLTHANLMPKTTIIDEKVICEEAKKLGLIGKITASTLAGQQKDKKFKAGVLVQKIKLMAGTIFQGEKLSAASTWKIIQYVVTFLIILSGTFYFTHIRQKKSIMFDTLTGVFTRGYIMDRLKEELKIARGSKNQCSLLILDVDKFKTINDTYGHSAGDTILKEFVVAVRRAVRATDLIGRYGGDEFLVILPTSAKGIARKIAEDIAEAVRTYNIQSGQNTFTITTSIGVSTFPIDSTTAEDLFNKADQALYATKRKGRDGVSVYGA